MNRVRYLGVALILLGLIGVIANTNISSHIYTAYASVTGFPASLKTPEQKISPTLMREIRTLSPDADVPVVLLLTAPEGESAMAQQAEVLPALYDIGFRITSRTYHVANTIAGVVKVGKIKELAENEYIDEILYDGKFAHILEEPVHIELLSQSVPQIGADKVWAMGYTGQGVTVIIIDTGVQNNHPWLMREGKSLVIKEYVTVPGAYDYTGSHGTHCAGIIASQNPKYKGVAPGIRGFVDIVALDSDGSARISWLLEALDKAYDAARVYKPCVCTNSWDLPPWDIPETNVVRNAAMKLADLIPVVFAAGNNGPEPNTISCPADADKDGNEVITVGAVDKSNNIADFSSRGPDRWGNEHNEPDVVAPGVNIISSVPGGSKPASGTSMAAPHVAGAIALMLSKNPWLSNKDCLNILTETALDRGAPGFDYSYGYGVVQADKAVLSVEKPPVPPVPNAWLYVSIGFLCTGLVLFSMPDKVERWIAHA